jgi:hypothetical protein
MEKVVFKLECSWAEVKENIKELIIELTDQDLEFQPGEEDALLERLEAKLGKSKEEIRLLIESASYTKGIAG